MFALFENSQQSIRLKQFLCNRRPVNQFISTVMPSESIHLAEKAHGQRRVLLTHISHFTCSKHTRAVWHLAWPAVPNTSFQCTQADEDIDRNAPTCWCSMAVKYACCSLCKNIRGPECDPAESFCCFSLPAVSTRVPFSLGKMKTACCFSSCFSTSQTVMKSDCG